MQPSLGHKFLVLMGGRINVVIKIIKRRAGRKAGFPLYLQFYHEIGEQDVIDCERFEPRSHFKRLSLIVRVNVVLNRTVVVDSD